MSTPESVETIETLYRAYLERRRGKYKQALEKYTILIEEIEESPELANAIAHCYDEWASSDVKYWEKFNDAISWYKRAIALSPNDSSLYYNLGRIFILETLDVEKGLEATLNAVSINPYYEDAWILLSTLEGLPEKLISLDDAISWLEKAISINPENYVALFNLALNLQKKGDIEKAKSALVKLLTSSGNTPRLSPEIILSQLNTLLSS